MALHEICRYDQQAAHGAGAMAGGGTITGHHLIADHCLYYVGGLRGMGDLSAFLCPGLSLYSTGSAPVVLVTADDNGGKSREHGLIHAIFDPLERKAATANGNQWTYAEARAAAVYSVSTVLSCWGSTQLTKILDDYFKGQCGLDDASMIRAGETGVMSSFTAIRKSGRDRVKSPSSRFSPY